MQVGTMIDEKIDGPYYAIERKDGLAELRSKLHDGRHVMGEIEKARDLARKFNKATKIFLKGCE
jgi:hypothetical protein